jgi:hypothetical protein
VSRFNRYRTLFAGVYDAVAKRHQKDPHRGHGMDHNAAVAMMGVSLCERDEVAAEMAFVAGLIHSTDRVVPTEQLSAELDHYLSLVPPNRFSAEQLAEIKEAVLRHDEYKDRNLATRKPTQKILMDADKLVNMNLLIVIRAGQHRPHIPAIELEFLGCRNPASTYKQPSSVIDMLRYVAEWAGPGWMHLPQAQQQAQAAAAQILDYVRKTENMFFELGLNGAKL